MGGSWNVLDEAAAGSSTARRGVYITLLAQQVEVLGEKGTKVGVAVVVSVVGVRGLVVRLCVHQCCTPHGKKAYICPHYHTAALLTYCLMTLRLCCLC
jgi:hypothetical protein